MLILTLTPPAATRIIVGLITAHGTWMPMGDPRRFAALTVTCDHAPDQAACWSIRIPWHFPLAIALCNAEDRTVREMLFTPTHSHLEEAQP